MFVREPQTAANVSIAVHLTWFGDGRQAKLLEGSFSRGRQAGQTYSGLAQSLGSYTCLSLQERERWLSETVGETLPVDPAQINALRVYSSTSDFEKGVAKHVHSVLYDEYVVMEAMQPYAVRHDGNAVCLPDVIALPDGQLQ